MDHSPVLRRSRSIVLAKTTTNSAMS